MLATTTPRPLKIFTNKERTYKYCKRKGNRKNDCLFYTKNKPSNYGNLCRLPWEYGSKKQNPTKKTAKGNTTYLHIIKIASAYGKSDVQRLINGSNIRYVEKNKNRVAEWLNVNRLQLPLRSSIGNSTSIITEKDDLSSENAYKKLWVVTSYINKKGELTEGSASDILSQQNTPETVLPPHSSNPIIRENFEKSTQNAKKIEKTSTSRKSIDVDEANKQLPKEGTARFSVELDGKSVAVDGEVTKNLVAFI